MRLREVRWVPERPHFHLLPFYAARSVSFAWPERNKWSVFFKAGGERASLWRGGGEKKEENVPFSSE